MEPMPSAVEAQMATGWPENSLTEPNLDPDIENMRDTFARIQAGLWI